MTTEHSRQPGLPAWKYPQHVEAVLVRAGLPADTTPEELQAHFEATNPYAGLYRSRPILGQNRPEAVGYGRNYRSAGYRKATGLSVVSRRQDLRLAGLCALLVGVLCAWIFYNANFATP